MLLSFVQAHASRVNPLRETFGKVHVNLFLHLPVGAVCQTQFRRSSNCDDWTDITLPLYAADGDIILTAYKKLQLRLEWSSPPVRFK